MVKGARTQLISTRSIVLASSDNASTEIAGEAVILNLQSGLYYGLNAVGARAWALLQQPRTVADIRDELLSEYDVEPEQCEADLIDLLAALSAEGLVEIRDNAPRN